MVTQFIRFTAPCAVFAAIALPAFAGEEAADQERVRQLAREIRLVPALPIAKEADTMPKFAVKALTPYKLDKKTSLAVVRSVYQANREKYAQVFPLRAAIFDAVETMEKILPLDLPMTLKEQSPMQRAIWKETGKQVGLSLFELEALAARMEEAQKLRAKEPSKRWEANFDFALGRVNSNVLFLQEYAFMVAQVRGEDLLPPLEEEHDGWMLSPRAFPARAFPNLGLGDTKHRNHFKENMKRWQTIQDDHPDTPWAFFAEQESRRKVGLVWLPKKK